MSRKDKKRQRYLESKAQETKMQEALRGWNCSPAAQDGSEEHGTEGHPVAKPLPPPERTAAPAAPPSSEALPVWEQESLLASEPAPAAAEEAKPDSTDSPMAKSIKGRVASRLSSSTDNLLKLFTGGQKPHKEQPADSMVPPPKQGAAPPSTAPKKASAAPSLQSMLKEKAALSPALQPLMETYEWAYTECYYIGIQVLRNLNDLRRWGFGIWAWMRYNIPYYIRTQRHRIARLFDHITDACLYPFRDIHAKTRATRSKLRKIARQEEPGKGKGSVSVFFRYLYSLGKPINILASFVLPILGCAVLAAVILYFQQLNYALEVDYSGVTLGYIATEGDFYEAKNRVYDRLINEEYAPLDDSRPTFRLVITDKENLLTPEALTNRIMTISKNEVAVADGVYIDGAFLGAVEDGSEFLFYIDSILDNYRTGTAHERVQFVKKVSLQRGIYPVSSVRPIHEIQNALESNQSLPQIHLVAKGETLESIAEKNNTTVEDVVKLNNILQLRSAGDEGDPYVREGETILVSRVELSLGIQVTRRETYYEDIDFGVDYQDDKKQLEGYLVTLSNGITGEREIVADVTYIDGEKVDEAIIERNVIQEPVNARKVRGTLRPAEFLPAGNGNTSASFIWPVAGGYMSAGLYGYYGHTGMDIAASQGTGIYAARAGTVTYASNRNVWPYGKRVSINHGDGVTTLYAHCSEVVVQPGQYVVQGQLIGKIGRTGNATGNHCHFEIRINGRVMDPEKFIGSWYKG